MKTNEDAFIQNAIFKEQVGKVRKIMGGSNKEALKE
jgi:hypothetical protein